MKLPKATPIALLPLVLCGIFVSSCTSAPTKTGTRATNLAELKAAISSGATSILVSDIDCEGTTFSINHAVTIDSIGKSSTLSEAYFLIEGPTVAGERIDVHFNNLILDGKVDATGIDLASEGSFESKFGADMLEKRAITCDSGYYDISLTSCTLTSYAAEYGAAIYLGYDALYSSDVKRVTLDSCLVLTNYSTKNICMLSYSMLETTITSCEFRNNYAYKGAGFSIANGAANVSKTKVIDNHFCPFDANQDDFQDGGGGVYFGAAEISMKECLIARNETIYGGGLCVSTPYAGNKIILFEDVVFLSNKAKYGGAVDIHSLSGQPITFLDCGFYKNSALQGSSLYTETFARWRGFNGGLVECLFSTFALNQAEDKNSYSFYQEEKTVGEVGTISLKGCISIGEDVYNGDNTYNYVETLAQAKQDGVIDDKTAASLDENGFLPASGTKADLKVEDSVYAKWSPRLSSYSGTRYIGKNATLAPSFPLGLVILICLVAGILILVVALTLFLVFFLPKRKQSRRPLSQGSDDAKRAELGPQARLATLSERERQVASMLIAGKRRKQIADELHYSENTIKKDLTNIYAKLGVCDKFELILKYKPLI